MSGVLLATIGVARSMRSIGGAPVRAKGWAQTLAAIESGSDDEFHSAASPMGEATLLSCALNFTRQVSETAHLPPPKSLACISSLACAMVSVEFKFARCRR